MQTYDQAREALPQGDWLILKSNMDWLTEKVAKLQARAEKLEVAPLALVTVAEMKLNTGYRGADEFVQVRLVGEGPKLAGWRLIAVVEPLGAEKLIRMVPGQDESLASDYRHAEFRCDHCNAIRRRKETFILARDCEHGLTETTQVGRACLKDFLGHSPERLLNWASWVADIAELLTESQGSDYQGDRQPRQFNLGIVLDKTAEVIKGFGWMSRTKAREIEEAEGRPVACTSGLVGTLLWGSDRLSRELAEELTQRIGDLDATREACWKLAADARAWAASLTGARSEYELNIATIARADCVQSHHFGMACSIVAAYQRHLDKQAQAESDRQAAPERKHVGEEGKRFRGMLVRVLSLREFESDYGVKTLVRMEDADRNVLIWWASTCPGCKNAEGRMRDLEEGQTYLLTASVKAHGDYKGTPQTVVTRAAFDLDPATQPQGAEALAVA